MAFASAAELEGKDGRESKTILYSWRYHLSRGHRGIFGVLSWKYGSVVYRKR